MQYIYQKFEKCITVKNAVHTPSAKNASNTSESEKCRTSIINVKDAVLGRKKKKKEREKKHQYLAPTMHQKA